MIMLVRRDIAVGAIAGMLATLVTDRCEGVLTRLTPDSELEKEPDISQGSSSGSAARMLLQQFGLPATGRPHALTKRLIHYGLGVAWGPLYCLGRRRGGLHPVVAGAVAGTSLSLIVDEFMNTVLGTTPPSTEFPASAHLRGLVTHVIWGMAAAAAAEAMFRLTDD
jgi:uncharacterized membrane protein YagU involved in acid resistance